MFDFIYNSRLPRVSSFCYRSLKVHLQASMEQFDNRVWEICLFHKIPMSQIICEQIKARISISCDDIERLKILLSTFPVLHKFKYNQFVRHSLCRLDIYHHFFIFANLKFDISNIAKQVKIMATERFYVSHFDFLVSRLNPDSQYNIAEYRRDMLNAK